MTSFVSLKSARVSFEFLYLQCLIPFPFYYMHTICFLYALYFWHLQSLVEQIYLAQSCTKTFFLIGKSSRVGVLHADLCVQNGVSGAPKYSPKHLTCLWRFSCFATALVPFPPPRYSSCYLSVSWPRYVASTTGRDWGGGGCPVCCFAIEDKSHIVQPLWWDLCQVRVELQWFGSHFIAP